MQNINDQSQIVPKNLFVPNCSVPFSMERNCTCKNYRGIKTVIDETMILKTELNNYFLGQFF